MLLLLLLLLLHLTAAPPATIATTSTCPSPPPPPPPTYQLKVKQMTGVEGIDEVSRAAEGIRDVQQQIDHLRSA